MELSPRSILKSLNQNYKSFVRFINTTNYRVEVIWIDYNGHAKLYKTLMPNEEYNINTFATHPWIFVEEETRDRFMVKCEDVFMPEPWFVRYHNIPRNQWPQRIERVDVQITIPIYTLRDLSLRVIKRHLKHDYQAFLLEIPKTLQYELASMQPRKGEPAEP